MFGGDLLLGSYGALHGVLNFFKSFTTNSIDWVSHNWLNPFSLVLEAWNFKTKVSTQMPEEEFLVPITVSSNNRRLHGSLLVPICKTTNCTHEDSIFLVSSPPSPTYIALKTEMSVDGFRGHWGQRLEPSRSRTQTIWPWLRLTMKFFVGHMYINSLCCL